MQGIYNRTELLLGSEVLHNIQSKKVIIFGVGGVGSWCAESLVRTGVCHITIVDADVVCESNINRQLMATTKTIGQPKVEVLKERLLDINPDAEIIALQKRYSLPPLPPVEGEGDNYFNLDSYDYIIDCIDSLKDKCDLLVNATTIHAKVYSSMGAALKVDPTQIKVTEFWKVRGCPLGAALRKKMKRAGLTLSQKVQCVYSEELLENKGDSYINKKPLPLTGGDDGCGSPMTFNKVQTNGSLVHITAIFGFTIAGLVIQDIIS